MNFFKRSLVSITRRKGKSLILFIAILLICNVIAGSISVKKALTKTEDNIAASMPIEIKIEVDYDVIYVKAPTAITEEQIKAIGISKYIKSTYYSYQYSLTSNTLKSALDDQNLYRNMVTSSKIWAGDEEKYFQTIGTSSNVIKEITNGKIKIVKGNVYSSDDIKEGNKVVIISKELAEKNKLEVGSKITLRRRLVSYSTGSEKVLKTISYDYKVVGIFEAKLNKVTDEKGNVVYENNPLADYIYMPGSTVKGIHDEVIKANESLKSDDYDDYTINASFFLNSIDNLADFNNENIKKLPSGYKFADNSELFTTTLAPMKNVESIADFVMYASIGASIVIIGLISLLFFRERKHEMGIYLALGEYKLKIALQVLLETLIISALAVVISIFTGNLLSKNISNNMLDNQITSSTHNEESYYDEYGYLLNYNKEDILNKYNVNLDATTILMIFIISLGSITVSTLIPIYYTLKINPKKILM